MKTAYHIPVLLNESIEGLNINPNGAYVDVTFGGGGHSRKIMESLDKEGALVAFDRDNDAIPNWTDERFYFANHNYSYLSNFLRYYNINKVDGILADLGISSHHIDEESRGFAFRFDAPLDMRMNQDQEKTAEFVVNEYSEADLTHVLKFYGEVKAASRVAKAIVAGRNQSRIVSTIQLVKLLEKFTPKRLANKFFAQIFQALRIEVNNELESLKKFLLATKQVLKPGGRLVVITYHSLEDRLVKTFLRDGNFTGEDTSDLIYGGKKSFFRLINKKVITPSEEELKINSRSRSAKLRIAEKI